MHIDEKMIDERVEISQEPSDSEVEDDENNDETKTHVNPGWADAMQKILKTNKPSKKKTLVLSKAKKVKDSQKLETVDEEKKKVKRLESKIRIKPSILDKDRERTLQKIATKGVVQLFNAVKQHQMKIDQKLTQAGPLERKRDQVYKNIDKRAFLDVLMGDSKSVPVDDTVKCKKSNTDGENHLWSVLRDDFVMGAKLKDWDKTQETVNDDI